MITNSVQGLQINTDASLVDPNWDEFATEHNRRYGLIISHLKSVVKGKAFDNGAIKLRVGPCGYYAQPKRFPAAFFGETTAPEHEFVSEDEARLAIWEAFALYRSGEAKSVVAYYNDGEPAQIFFGYRTGESRRYEMGWIRTELPLPLRVVIEGPCSTELLDGGSGVLIYQRTRSGQHLLLRASGKRVPYLAYGEVLD